MAAVSDNDPPCFLADLPEELNLAIIKELDMASCIALSRTSKQFQRLAEVSRRNKLQHFLVRARSFPQWRDGFRLLLVRQGSSSRELHQCSNPWDTRPRRQRCRTVTALLRPVWSEYGLVSKLEVRWYKSMEYGSCAGAAEDYEVAGSMSDA
jgi:hypothetical protein